MSEAADYLERIDERLWIFRANGCGERDFLVGNSHTFRGRMGAYCPTQDVGYSISLSEIDEMSPESARWVAGFLSGNEPEAEEMFGPGIHDANDSDSRWQRWRDALAEFRATGVWSHAGWGHLIPFPPGTVLPAFVWTLRGDEVWAWTGEAWARADPQPPRTHGLLQGTLCFERGHCNMAAVTTAHVVCDDCGDTAHTVPAEFTSDEWERVQY